MLSTTLTRWATGQCWIWTASTIFWRHSHSLGSFHVYDITEIRSDAVCLPQMLLNGDCIAKDHQRWLWQLLVENPYRFLPVSHIWLLRPFNDNPTIATYVRSKHAFGWLLSYWSAIRPVTCMIKRYFICNVCCRPWCTAWINTGPNVVFLKHHFAVSSVLVIWANWTIVRRHYVDV